MRTMTSLGRRPARAAGPPATTCVMTTPCSTGRLNWRASWGVTSTSATPRKARSTRPCCISASMMGRAVAVEMANPTPSACPPRITAVVMPTTSPRMFTSGPPELPGLMAASVWMAPGMVTPHWSSWMVRSLALTTPLVTVGPPGRFRALPMATTSSPICSASESPRVADVRPLASIFSTAKSVSGSRPTIRAGKRLPSDRVTVMFWAGESHVLGCTTTWLLVTM
ncbi:hypothetical protein HRbin24_01860 [bacterium HR24]|nr:hypothetical protein HRbin24_01860 [bacterium HR24]